MRWWRRRWRDADLERELRADLELEEEEQRDRGLSEEEARYAARRALGNTTLIREQTHAIWSWSWLESAKRDLRYTIRTLAHSPGFSLAVMLVMALGIGSTVAMFTVVYSVLMKPLPYHNQGRLVRIYDADAHNLTHNQIAVAGPDFFDWEKQQHSFQQMAIAYNWNSYDLSGTRGQLPEHVMALTASWNIFRLLGVKPALGRFFDRDDDRRGAEATVVLSWGLWKRRYGGKRDVLGKTILLDAKPYTVIGVLPAGVDYPDRGVQLWTPFFHETPPQWMQSHTAHNFQVIGLLKPGFSVAQAQAELSAIQAGIHTRHPSQWVASAAHVVPLLEARVGRIKPALLMLFAATLCLLFIGCLNVANLLVARSATRRREAAIRTALGGGRWRLIREQLFESMLLCIGGGVVGLFVAWLAIRWLASTHPDIPRVEGIHLSGVVALVGCAIMLCSGLLAGLIPLLGLKQGQILSALQDSARSQRGGQSSARTRGVLLTLEVALTVILLVGASLLLKSYAHLRSVNLGCRTQHVLTMGIALPDATYKTPGARVNFYSELLRRVRALPGVQAATLTDALPGDGEPPDFGFSISENPPLAPGQTLDADVVNVAPNYFQTMQIPLIKGRFFLSNERLKQSHVAIVSQSFAREFLPNRSPLGKHIRFSSSRSFEIVGVVGDVRGTVASRVQPTMYFPLYGGEEDSASLAVVTNPNPRSLALPIQKIVAEMNPNLAVSDVLTIDQIIGRSTADSNIEAWLVAGFAFVSLLLAALGLFGVLSYLATQRQGEIGLRLALGARREQILRLMLLDGLRPALLGLAVGLISSAASARLIRSLLYGTTSWDPLMFAAVAILLMAVAIAACLLPAWRASLLDPMQTLRTE